VTLVRRIGLAALAALVVALVTAPVAVPRSAAAPRTPVVKVKNARYGYILQSKNRLPLYYWKTEKNAGGKIRCTGDCATAWPPLIVKSRKSVAAKLQNIKGKFGVIRRPDGRLQVTFRGLALYAYHNDPPNTVLCDNVDGWFVIRV
jgi:predicted lipoprotein with Yx(FWY)xxD motif